MAAKLQGLCKGFKKLDDTHWVQEDLEDELVLKKFVEGHERHLPFKDQVSEEALFEAVLANVKGISKCLKSDSAHASRYWPHFDLFKIRSFSTFMGMIESRSSYLKKMSCELWWTLLYQHLPELPNSVTIQILEEIKDKTSLEYILASISSGHLSSAINYVELDLVTLVLVLREMLGQNIDESGAQKAKTALREKLIQVNLDDWIGLTEVENASHKVGDHIPSNMQLLVAHCCFEIGSKLAPEDELNRVLSNFAREYQKEYELHLDNLDLTRVIAKLENEEVEWKIEAYVKNIMSQEEKFKDSETTRVLIKHASYLVTHLDTIYDLDDEKKLLCAVLKFSPLNDVQDIATKEISKECRQSALNINDLRSFINKAVLSDDIEKDWLILVIQDPAQAVRTLIIEGINNPGKIPLVCHLISRLPLLETFQIPCLLMQHLEQSQDAKNLVVKLCEHIHFMKIDLFDKLSKLMLTSEANAHLCLEILSQIDLPSSVSADNLETFRRFLLRKSCTTLDDAVLLEGLDRILCKDSSNQDFNLFSLVYLRHHQWPIGQDPIFILEMITALIECLPEAHQEFVLVQLSQYLIANVDSILDLSKAHDYLILLLREHSGSSSLQNCQIAVLSKLLASDHDQNHLISILATLPNCDAKKLSLTKLQMLSMF